MGVGEEGRWGPGPKVKGGRAVARRSREKGLVLMFVLFSRPGEPTCVNLPVYVSDVQVLCGVGDTYLKSSRCLLVVLDRLAGQESSCVSFYRQFDVRFIVYRQGDDLGRMGNGVVVLIYTLLTPDRTMAFMNLVKGPFGSI